MSGRVIRVLLVEDLDDDAALVTRQLHKDNFAPEISRVQTAEQMAAALEKGRFDVVLSDFSLPGFDAWGALDTLHLSGRDLPFIVVSGTVGEEVAVALMRKGAHDYVMKDNLKRLAPAVEREIHEAFLRSERHGAEDALRKSDERFRALGLATNDVILDWDLSTTSMWASDAMSRIFGHAQSQFDSTWYLGQIHPEDAGARQVIASLASDAHRYLISAEFRFRREDGTYADVFLRGILLPGRAPGPRRLVASMMDVSERRALEVRMLQVDRMVTVGTLAAGVAHEINNPLTYVLSNLELIDRAVPKLEGALNELGSEGPAARAKEIAAEFGELIADVRTGAERVRGIVKGLRTFSRADDDTISSVDIRKVVEGAMGMVGPEVVSRARFITDFQHEHSVRANEGKLSQVFLNLLVNAAHAIAPGRPSENQIKVTTREIGPLVEVNVTDTGSGIKPEHLGRIFDPFFTTKPVGEGTGLGLSIVHNIVKSIGGEIRVDSHLGKGTTFSVRLPAQG